MGDESERSDADKSVADNSAEKALEEAALRRGQMHLLELQAKQLEDEHSLRLSQLHSQLLDLRIKRFSQRLQNCLQMVAAAVAAIGGVGLAILLYDAVTSRSVVIESFNTPPALEARGVNGRVVAGGVLDALSRLQAATRSKAAKRSLANAWTGDIKIEVPETGISIGELERVLKARFGHDLHVDGDLVQTADGGLALTVRGDGVAPRSFTGGANELDALIAQAAEHIFGQSQPSIYASHLIETGRSAEAVGFSRTAFATASEEDRPYLLNQWANALQNVGGSVDESIGLYRQALALKPDYWAAYANIMLSTVVKGREQDAWAIGNQLRKRAGGRPGRAPELIYQTWDELTWNLPSWRAGLAADAAANSGAGSGNQLRAPRIAVIDVRLHDPSSAVFQLGVAAGAQNDRTVTALTHFVRGQLAAEAGQRDAAAAEMEAFGAAFADKTVASNYPGYDCWIAPALDAAGQPAKADAVLAAAGRHVDCYRFRADILDRRGDWPAARSAYAAAVALAPDLPAAYYSWGLALARHGDVPAALAKLEAANARAPGWADPLKAWGDVLASQRRWSDAERKYDRALKLAPHWEALKQAKAIAQRRGGRLEP